MPNKSRLLYQLKDCLLSFHPRGLLVSKYVELLDKFKMMVRRGDIGMVGKRADRVMNLFDSILMPGRRLEQHGPHAGVPAQESR